MVSESTILLFEVLLQETLANNLSFFAAVSLCLSVYFDADDFEIHNVRTCTGHTGRKQNSTYKGHSKSFKVFYFQVIEKLMRDYIL